MRAIGFHWHAVQRDLLALGFRAVDMFTPKLTAAEVISIIVAAPGTSALRWSIDEGYTLTDHLLATISEQQDGLVNLRQRHPRPGADTTQQHSGTRINGVPADVVSIADFEARRTQILKRRKG